MSPAPTVLNQSTIYSGTVLRGVLNARSGCYVTNLPIYPSVMLRSVSALSGGPCYERNLAGSRTTMSISDDREPTSRDAGELLAEANAEQLHDFAALARYFRSHPLTPWDELRRRAVESGYTEDEIDLVWWCLGVEAISREDEAILAINGQRN